MTETLKTSSNAWRDAIVANEYILERMKKNLGVRSIVDVFKASFINGFGSSELTKEEARYVEQDIKRFYENNVLPLYVQRAYCKQNPQ